MSDVIRLVFHYRQVSGGGGGRGCMPPCDLSLRELKVYDKAINWERKQGFHQRKMVS